MRVVFRTDASSSIGSGHVMRCLTLARMLQTSGAEVSFVSRLHSGHLIERIRAEGFACVALDSPLVSSASIKKTSDYAVWLGASPAQDAAAVIEALGQIGSPDWLVVDHYGIGEEWERLLRPHCDHLMVIDDLANRRHDCDLLLDQNLVDQQESRYEHLVSECCVKLLGPRYALLQTDYVSFHHQSRPRHSPARRIFAYFGAADESNVCGRVVQAFTGLAGRDVALDVIASPASSSWPSLVDQVGNDDRVRLHGYVSSLAPFLQDADVAFGAGGATSWERCCLGVPAYVVTLAENQVPGTQALARLGAVRWLGDAMQVSDAELRDAMREALEGEVLSSMSTASLSLVDGWGAARVAAALSAGPETEFVVRSVEPSDERLTLDWANDPAVRQNSFSAGRIDAHSHHHWFSRRMADVDNCRFYVVQMMTGLPAGPVRFERVSPGVWEIHYSLDHCLRGRRVGVAFLKAALDHFCRATTSANMVVGRVKSSNYASQHIFRKLGFSKASDSQGFLYQLNLQR